MKVLITISLLALLFNSCMDYATVKAINKPEEKVALQDFYSPCCGSCGQRIVAEIKGKQYALQVNCEIENEYSRRCTPLGIGTQKHVISYRKRKVINEEYYKPVFDTIELKKMYPKTERGEYYDSSLAREPIIPLNAIDSLLIDKYYALTTKKPCSDKYLKLIRGYIKINPKNADLLIDNKKVKFRTKHR